MPIMKIPVNTSAADSSGQSFAKSRKSKSLLKLIESVVRMCMGSVSSVLGICVSTLEK